MKNYLLAIIAFLLFSAVSAQIVVPIENQNSLQLNPCDSAIITAGAYSGATIQSIDISLDENSAYTAIINPAFFGQQWDIDATSELRFYDGFEESALLLATYNSATNPDGFFLPIETGSLRIEMETSEGSSGNGFELDLLCNEALQDLPSAKFKPQLTENWYFDENLEMYVFRSCLNDSITLAVEPVYLNPQAENQNVDSLIIKWSLGDRTFKRDTGLTSIDHIYTSGSGHLVTVYSQDISGQSYLDGPESYLKFVVQNSAEPVFSLNEQQPFCLNEISEIEGGMSGDEVLGAEGGLGTTSITEFFGTLMYLPDGSGYNYFPLIEVSGFPEGTTISSASDLAALCVNMEHSYLGDLEMMLTCPDGTGINIFNAFTGEGLFAGGFGGVGIYLGDANDDMGSMSPGIGFDYCFSDDAEWGTLGDEFELGNTVPVSTFNSGIAMSPGTFLPEESFAGFIGCPVNGEWILTVRDNLAVDNGYIFDWSLGFSEELSTSGFQNELVSASWETNDWITSVNEGSVEVTPQNIDPHDLTFNVADENGCSFSKTLTVQVTDTLIDLSEPAICNLIYELEWPAAIGELNYVSGPSSNVSITNVGEIIEVEVPEAGDYTFEFSYFDCGSAVQAHLIFLEEDNPACITGINEIDLTKEVLIAPNPAANYAQLKFEIEKSQTIEIAVSTLDSKMAFKDKVKVSPGEQNHRINLEKLLAGAYLVTITGETFQSSRLLIKQ